MKYLTQKALVIAIAAGTAQVAFSADSMTAALKETKASGAFNLRYEDVDNSSTTSDGITLRSRITATTGTYENFSFVAGFEDVRDVFGVDDENGLIPDPEVTEVDQAFMQYKTDDATVKIGRQVITMDNQRYVGHVGWRQDRQTYDAMSVVGKTGDFNYSAAYIYKYNRIFAETADFDASTVLLNGSYTLPAGKITGYVYSLDNQDNDAEGNNHDTIGIRFAGATKGETSFLYTAEVAQQSSDSYDATYYLLEGGVKFAPGITVKAGYEVRGSDDGDYGFSTPLATGHAFNGWADVYLGPGNDGMSDLYVSVGGKAGPVNLLGVYHTYESDSGSTDKGDEINLLATMPLGGGFSAGIKYAAYSQGDDGTTPDRDKLWTWFGYSF